MRLAAVLLAAWIAEADGARVGCIFCMKKDDVVAQLRMLLVEPSTRGVGMGESAGGRMYTVREAGRL
jgi:N-acetylglutamate synthase-like GNAT family acetyltransferase